MKKNPLVTIFQLRTISHFYHLMVQNIYNTAIFIILLATYVTYRILSFGANVKIIPSSLRKKLQMLIIHAYFFMLKIFDPQKEGQLGRVDLIELSIKNMKFKKTRSMVTIGGMAIAVGSIVFFISLGYGLQNLVISRVAQLDELKQADVTSQIGNTIKIDDKALAHFKQIPHVKDVQPVISVVGEVNYHGSVSDVAVYGVTTDYLTNSTIKPEAGKFYQNNLLAVPVSATSSADKVKGISISPYATSSATVHVSITPKSWIRVRQSPSLSAHILGYTQDINEDIIGKEVTGEMYKMQGISSTSNNMWIKATVPLWKDTPCSNTQSNCIDGHYLPLLDPAGKQIYTSGYMANINMNVTQGDQSVLGVSTATSTSSQNNGSLSMVEIASLSAQQQSQQTKTVTLSSTAQKVAVINDVLLKELGLTVQNAIGKTFQIQFIVTGNLLSHSNEKIQSAPEVYTIVGVISGDQSPVLYTPFVDIRSLGVNAYSQAKVTVDNPDNLAHVRQQIESEGFSTNSVADTVSQINSIFATARVLLSLLGFVALAVASLGMFNTLTVSLLERTREVGLMKTMGMESHEVKDLFLTESMIMTFFGGIIGLLGGMLFGKMLGILLSVISIMKGVGIIDVSYTPLIFVLIILVLSLLIGIITGIYPAYRATKISALDALRYE